MSYDKKGEIGDCNRPNLLSLDNNQADVLAMVVKRSDQSPKIGLTYNTAQKHSFLTPFNFSNTNKPTHALNVSTFEAEPDWSTATGRGTRPVV